MEATHGPDDADHCKEPSKGHKRKKGTKKSQVDDVDKGSKNKKSSKKAQQKKDCSPKKAKKQPAKNRRKVAAAKEQDLPVAALGKAEQKAERKKRYSRKSAAYHRVYKSTAGTVEEKKAAAKKAHCLQLYMFCHSVQCHASMFDPYISFPPHLRPTSPGHI